MKSITLVITCAGRRVELLQAFRTAARTAGLELRLVAIDSARTAPAMYVADEALILPPVENAEYVPALLAVIQRLRPQAVLPTTDTDLVKLAEAKVDVANLGCLPLIGDPDVIAVCRDKLRTAEFLAGAGFDTPRILPADDLQRLTPADYPLLLKPRSGSASHRVHKLLSPADLTYHLAQLSDAIVQEFVDGVEHTLDVYVGLTGEPRCVVVRQRWAVRTGEVVKAVTVKDPEIMEAGRRVTAALGASLRGLVTVQCFVTPERRIRFIEINPRFGGGAPLGIAAGANYPLWLLQELAGQTPEIQFDGWQDRLCMFRYDWSVFVRETALNEPSSTGGHTPAPPFPAT